MSTHKMVAGRCDDDAAARFVGLVFFYRARRQTPLPADLNFSLSPAIIEACCEKIVAETRAVHDAVGALPLEQVSWSTTIERLVVNDDKFAALSAAVTFPMHVSTDAAVRAASAAATAKLDALGIELSGRKDVFQRLARLATTAAVADGAALDRRLLTETLSDYERQGVKLEGEKYDRLQAINKRLSKLSTDYSQTMNEDATKLLFDESELAGMPADFIAALPLVDGKRELTLKYPHLFPVRSPNYIPMRSAFRADCLAFVRFSNSARLRRRASAWTRPTRPSARATWP